MAIRCRGSLRRGGHFLWLIFVRSFVRSFVRLLDGVQRIIAHCYCSPSVGVPHACTCWGVAAPMQLHAVQAAAYVYSLLFTGSTGAKQYKCRGNVCFLTWPSHRTNYFYFYLSICVPLPPPYAARAGPRGAARVRQHAARRVVEQGGHPFSGLCLLPYLWPASCTYPRLLPGVAVTPRQGSNLRVQSP